MFYFIIIYTNKYLQTMKNLLTISLILFLSQTSFAQKYDHSKITEEIKYIMLLDSKEQLWYSDGNNIVMYDGEFHKQNIVPLKNKTEMWEDNDGTIWGVNEKGIICYKQNEWKEYPYENEDISGSTCEIIFKDKSNRIYFFNKKTPMYGSSSYYVAIFEDVNITCITNNLPEKINYVCEYKDGAVFGTSAHGKPCGYFNGKYEYLTQGNVYNFYNSWEGLLSSDATNLKTPEMFEKYQNIKIVDLAGDTLLFITDKLGVCYFRNTNSFKEFKLPKEHLNFVEKDGVALYYTGNTFYIISLNKGILEIKENSSRLFNKKNGLPDNELSYYFIDKNFNLVLMHPKASSVLLDGEWKYFDKKSGYELNALVITTLLELNTYKYIAAYNTSGMSKKNILLRWDGSTWKIFNFESRYSFTYRIKPFIFNNDIWFFNHNGNTYKGLLYFDGKTFTDYPLGKKVKDNLISTISFSEKSFYVHTSGVSGKGSLLKITLK